MLGITDLLVADLLEIDRALGLHFVPDHIRGRGTGLRAVDHPVNAEHAADALRGLLVADKIEDQLLAAAVHRVDIIIDRHVPSPWLCRAGWPGGMPRSEEHTSELQSLMRISYAVFCLKKKK